MEILWPVETISAPVVAGTVHVWAASLDVSRERLSHLERTLIKDEIERAARFRGVARAKQFVAARGLLRELLGTYISVQPSDVRFEYDANGKPSIAQPARNSPLQFNVSHASGMALYAISLGARVGVDVEEIVPFPHMTDVATRFFSAVERSALAAVPRPRYPLAFYCCWTRKEAYLKANGVGLRVPLDSFDVSVDPDEESALLQSGGDVAPSHRWWLAHLRPANEYVGAIAVEAPASEVICRRWTGNAGAADRYDAL